MSRSRMALTRCPLLLATIIIFAAQVGCFSADDPERWEKAIADLKAPNLTVRQAAASSLVDLALQAASEKRTPDQAEALKRRLNALAEVVRNKGEDPGVRAELVHAIGIGEFGSLAAGTTPTLIEVLVDETDQSQVRSWCAMVLPEIGPPETVAPAILAASQSRDLAVTVNASQALGRVAMAPETLLPLLQRAIDDPSASVRTAAVSAAEPLARTDKQALSIVFRAIHDSDEINRRTALVSLEALRGKTADAKNQLLGLLKDPEPAIRAEAVKHEDPFVRAVALSLLGSLKPDRAAVIPVIIWCAP